MAFRELSMIEVKELLIRFKAGESLRRVARECGADRKTVRRYYEAAEECGVREAAAVTDELVAAVAAKVQGRPAPAPSDCSEAMWMRDSAGRSIQHVAG